MHKRSSLGLMFLVKLVVAVIFIFIIFKIVVMILSLGNPSSASLASLDDIGEEVKVLAKEARGKEGQEASIKMPVQIDEGDCIRGSGKKLCLHNNCEDEPYKCIELDMKFDGIAVSGAKGIKTIVVSALKSGGDITVSIQDMGGAMPAAP